MSGKRGQKGTGSTEIADRYSADFLEELDGRVRTAKTLRQRLRALIADLGGESELSYQEMSLVKRCIHVERLLERRESTLAHGASIDDQAYFSGITTLSSLFTKLGLKRRAKPVQTIEQYLESRAQTPDAESEDTTNTEDHEDVNATTHHS